jgi:hypothetical protein
MLNDGCDLPQDFAFFDGFALLSATASRMSVLKAAALTSSPSWMSIARRTFPSRLELKAATDPAVVRPGRSAHPLPLFDDIGISFLDEFAHSAEGFPAPVSELRDALRDELRCRLSFARGLLFHVVILLSPAQTRVSVPHDPAELAPDAAYTKVSVAQTLLSVLSQGAASDIANHVSWRSQSHPTAPPLPSVMNPRLSLETSARPRLSRE